MTISDEKVVASAATAPPSAPVGVEGLMQLARNWCLTWGEWAHDADPGGAKENAAETALRAALTTALAQQPAACPKCDGTGEADSGGIHPWGAPATIPCDCQQPAMPNGVVEAARVLADFAETAPGRLPGRVQDAIATVRAADNRDAAGVDAEEDAYVIDRLAHLLAEISVIVNGPEPAGTKWSYHDLPAKVAAMKGGAQ